MFFERPSVKFDRPFRHLRPHEKARSLQRVRAQLGAVRTLWVFAYGSLMWRPCYPAAESRPAQLHGFARRLCVWTIEARGTPDCPGLGVGLEADSRASCDGVVHRVVAAEQDTALAALWDREMLTGVYRPEWISVATAAGEVRALSFVADSKHPQYAAQQSIDWQAERVASAIGVLGSCLEYVERTVEALDSMGVHDQHLHRVVEQARRLAGDKQVRK